MLNKKHLRQALEGKQEDIKKLLKDNENLGLKKVKSKIFAEDVLKQLNLLDEIEKAGYSDRTKKMNRNLTISTLRKQAIDIIKELDESGKHI